MTSEMASTMPGIDALVDPATLERLDGLDTGELGELFERLDELRRRTEAALAVVIGAVERRGEYRVDGHRTVNAWCRAHARWSDAECRDHLRVARLVAADDRFRGAVLSGRIGVAQTGELARAHGNPRCGHRLAEIADTMIDHAQRLPFHAFRLVVRRWEILADADGAHRAALAAHHDRRAGIYEVGDEVHLHARWGLAQGAIIREVFERFCDAEFAADWDTTRAALGDAAHPASLERSDAQRGADALAAIFRQAAAAPPDATSAAPLVNLVVDVASLEQLLTGESTAADGDLRWRRCDTTNGTPIPAADALAAIIWGRIRRVVVDPAGVIINMGRRQRLFTRNARDAALLQSPRCVAAGCNTPIRHCQADHLTAWSRHGPTDTPNSAPLCAHHNRLKNTGYHIHRDPTGHWHTYRPDGTEIG